MKLQKGERIITAFAESANGPGWSNSPVFVIVQAINGELRTECIQPEDQTRSMISLYPVSQAAHLSMVNAVAKAYNL